MSEPLRKKPAPPKRTYIQQIHAGCGGRLVCAVNRSVKSLGVACDRCHDLWEVESPMPAMQRVEIPKDWEDGAKKEKANG